jgi:hypothetical protein
MQPPIHLPNGASNVYVRVNSAAIWNTTPNVITSVNDKITMRVSPSAPWIELTVPQGIYNVNQLNETIQRLFANSNETAFFTISADQSTQRVIINPAFETVEIDFTAENSLRNLLGFESSIVGGTSHIYGTTSPKFTPSYAFNICTDLVNNGITTNGVGGRAVAVVPVSEAPGSLINFSPPNMIPIPCEHLKNSARQSISVYVTDTANKPLIMFDDWGVVLEIVYSLPSADSISSRDWY